MLSSLGLAVAREIPAAVIPGLISGAYSVHGGVIRNGLGQIVTHLATGGASSAMSSLVPGLGTLTSLINAGQIYAVSRDVQQVQQTVNTVLSFSMASTALSGLGVVTSIAGFAYLKHRLDKVDTKLAQLEKQIKEIRILIQSQQKAQLHTAIDCLQQAELTTNKRLRHELLMQSKSSFTTLAHYYRELWGKTGEIHETDGVDEYFTLAFTGAALATSELGMPDVAFVELQRHYTDWQNLARQHCSKYLLKQNPQRLMDSAYVKDISTKELIDTLDFVNGTQRGIEWIDEFRAKSDSIRIPRPSLPGTWQPFSPTDERPAIDFALRLRARSEVLQTNVAHFEFLKDKSISANDFSMEVKQALKESNNLPICIYG